MRELVTNAVAGRVSMTLRDVLFAHWPVEPAAVDSTLPMGLAPDTHDGDAWLGIVAFRVSRASPSFFPAGRSFGEVNLRTYVTPEDGTFPSADGDGGERSEGVGEGERGERAGGGRGEGDRDDHGTGTHRGTYFYSLEVGDRLSALANRRLTGLQYHRADATVEREGDRVRVQFERTEPRAPEARFAATYGPDGEPFDAPSDDLARFLVERYRFYAVDGRGRHSSGDIHHEPWRLFPATADVRENTLFETAGVGPPTTDPLLHYCPRMEITPGRVWWN